jgi:hypothetical protein
MWQELSESLSKHHEDGERRYVTIHFISERKDARTGEFMRWRQTVSAKTAGESVAYALKKWAKSRVERIVNE